MVATKTLVEALVILAGLIAILSLIYYFYPYLVAGGKASWQQANSAGLFILLRAGTKSQ